MQNSAHHNSMPEYIVTPSSSTPINPHKGSGLLMLLIGFLAAAVLAVGFFAYTNYQTNQQLSGKLTALTEELQQAKADDPAVGGGAIGASPIVAPSMIAPTPTPTPTLSPAVAMGTITGKLSYPAEMMPTEKVCAQNTSTGKEICQTFTKSTYELSVPPADYQVYAMVADDPANKNFPKNTTKAFYSEFVTCGLNAKCPSHKPIEFKVSSGETVKGIDPQDWYAN